MLVVVVVGNRLQWLKALIVVALSHFEAGVGSRRNSSWRTTFPSNSSQFHLVVAALASAVGSRVARLLTRGATDARHFTTFIITGWRTSCCCCCCW